MGKTILSKELGRILDVPVIHLGEIILHPKLRVDIIEKEDSERGSLIIRADPFKKWIRREVSNLGNSIIESHFTDLVPPDLLSHCIILTTHPATLQDRLKRRKWSLKKIKENVQAEILGNCVFDVIRAFKDHNIVLHEIDTTSNKINEQVQSIIDCFQVENCVAPKINWLRDLSSEQLKEYFEY